MPHPLNKDVSLVGFHGATRLRRLKDEQLHKHILLGVMGNSKIVAFIYTKMSPHAANRDMTTNGRDRGASKQTAYPGAPHVISGKLRHR